MLTIQNLIKEIRNLKPIPAVVNQLLTLADDPDSSMEDITGVIKYDPVITGDILKLCNSAFFGLKTPVESIKDAVSFLGMDQIIEFALMESSAAVLSGNYKGYDLEPGDLWKYSVSSAVIAKKVAARLSLKNRNTIFTSALIKDVGKIILEKYVLRFSEEIQDLVEHHQLSFREAEKKIFGIDHAELGAMIAKMWKLSPRMIRIIKNHHMQDKTMIMDKEVSVVYLSDCICMMMGIGAGSDGLAYRFHDEVVEQLGFSADDVAMIIADFTFNMKEIKKMFKIV